MRALVLSGACVVVSYASSLFRVLCVVCVFVLCVCFFCLFMFNSKQSNTTQLPYDTRCGLHVFLQGHVQQPAKRRHPRIAWQPAQSPRAVLAVFVLFVLPLAARVLLLLFLCAVWWFCLCSVCFVCCVLCVCVLCVCFVSVFVQQQAARHGCFFFFCGLLSLFSCLRVYVPASICVFRSFFEPFLCVFAQAC